MINLGGSSFRESGFKAARRDLIAFPPFGGLQNVGARPPLLASSSGGKVPKTGALRRGKALSAFSVLILLMLIWGPPRLRLEGRDATAALDSSTNQDAAAQFQIAIVLAATILAASIFLVLKKSGLAKASELLTGPLRWYALLSLSAVFSAIYSVNAIYTAYFSLKLFVAWALPVLLIAHHGENGLRLAMSSVRWVFFSQMLAILFLWVVAPDVVGFDIPGVGYRLTGGTLVDFGTSGAISLVFVVGFLSAESSKGRRAVLLAMGAPCLLYLYAARSRGTILSTLTAIVITLLLSLRRRVMSVGAVLVAAFGVVVVAVLGLALSSDQVVRGATKYLMRGQSEQELLSGSGRTLAFSFLIDVWKERPYFGHGYAAGTREALLAFMAQTGLKIGSGHDVLSRTLTDLGLVGALLIALVYISSLRLVRRAFLKRQQSQSSEQRRNVAVAAGLVMIALMQGDASAGISDATAYFAIAITLLTIALSRSRSIHPIRRRFGEGATSFPDAHYPANPRLPATVPGPVGSPRN